MNGIHNCRCNGDPFRGNDPMSSGYRGSYRYQSADNCSPSMANASRRSGPTPTPSPCNLNQNRSRSRRKSTEPLHTPSWKKAEILRNLSTLPTNPSCTSSPLPSRSSTTPIMFSNSSGMLKPPPIVNKLECTLEELCYGCQKKIKITREVLTITRGTLQEQEILTINVKPGWKKGTKITFEGKGNERHGAYREDVVFFISEKRHHLFRREGDDLELAVKIPLLKALTGFTIPVPLLGDQVMNLTVEDIVYPGYEKIINGQGMPISKEPHNRGNLKIKFLVQFPTQLTHHQRSEAVIILQDSC